MRPFPGGLTAVCATMMRCVRRSFHADEMIRFIPHVMPALVEVFDFYWCVVIVHAVAPCTSLAQPLTSRRHSCPCSASVSNQKIPENRGVLSVQVCALLDTAAMHRVVEPPCARLPAAGHISFC